MLRVGLTQEPCKLMRFHSCIIFYPQHPSFYLQPHYRWVHVSWIFVGLRHHSSSTMCCHWMPHTRRFAAQKDVEGKSLLRISDAESLSETLPGVLKVLPQFWLKGGVRNECFEMYLGICCGENLGRKLKVNNQYLVVFLIHAAPVAILLQVANGSSTYKLCMHNCSSLFEFSWFVEDI